MFGLIKQPELMAKNQPINVNVTVNVGEFTSNQFTTINSKLDRIMATFEEISAKVDALQASLDNEQAQIAAAIEGLNQSIVELQNQIANGATPEQLQVLANKLDDIKTDLEGTIADPSTGDEETPA